MTSIQSNHMCTAGWGKKIAQFYTLQNVFITYKRKKSPFYHEKNIDEDKIFQSKPLYKLVPLNWHKKILGAKEK